MNYFELENQDQRESDMKLHYSEAIERAGILFLMSYSTGFGRFQWLLLLVCGMANASDAVEILCVSFLLPSAECDLHLTSSDKGWLSAIIFIGMMLGSYIWGMLGDYFGRRMVLVAALLVNGGFGCLSSLSQQFSVFLVIRLFSGFGVGGSIPVVWSYFAEFQTEESRPHQMCLLASFWMVGNIVTAGLAWIIIPLNHVGYFSDDFVFDSWRIFVVACSSVAIIAALCLLLFPESPMFLLKKGREHEAVAVLEEMYRKNNPKMYETVPYQVLGLHVETNGDSNSELTLSTRWFTFLIRTAHSMLQQTKNLFQPTTRRASFIFVIINFTLAFSYYGLWMWYPELFSRMTAYARTHNNSEVNVCSFPSDSVNTNVTSLDCSNPVDITVFFDSFLISLSSLPSNLITIMFMYKARRVFLSLGMVLTGLSVFLIWIVKNRTHSLILSSVFGCLSMFPYNSLNVVTAESFSTDLRATAMGFFLVFGRIGAVLGNVVFGELVDYHCAIPVLLVATFLASSGMLSLLIPRTDQRTLV
ncbi:synaptic vesicle glycoprotein 2C-like isoform X2 [Tachypleus tridentatus]|uniref:synaptic vesicle glycoprotein 2C-like isoform X2 n=1 Tax=Tachypleus tridentatus TaxID=6853 RepID=UPI003FCFA0D8